MVTRGFGRLPLSNIVPFTYRDGMTFAKLLYSIRDYMVETLHPEMVNNLNKIIEEVNRELGEMGDLIVTNNEHMQEVYNLFVERILNSNAETLEEVYRRIDTINNKTGPVDIQRITLTVPSTTLTIDPAWPSNHPIQFVVTQDSVGGRLLVPGPDIEGSLSINTAPGTITDFVIVPQGNGKWRPVITPSFNHLPVDASLYGAIGDGIKDETAAINAALLANPGRTIRLSRGNHIISGELNVKSNTTVEGETGGTKITNVNPAATSSFFVVSSGFGSFTQIAASLTSGDKTITTKTAHGLVVGDFIQLQSQRVSTSADAKSWRLGFSTINTSGPFFGEFARVYSVENTRSFTIDTGLIFPEYHPDNSKEEDLGAGVSATIRRVTTSARNVVIRNLELAGPSSTAIRVYGGVDCRIENIRYIKPNTGRFIQFQESYRCKAVGCWVDNLNITPDDGDHAETNSYHIVSSQNCGFDNCEAIRGTQSYDITYSNAGRIPSVNCFITNSSASSSLFNCVTTHPGTYGSVISNNRFLECRRSGITSRSRNSLITGNIISGSLTEGRQGIGFSEGAGSGSLVTGNHISNFCVGVSVADGGEKPYGDDPINISFIANVFVNFDFGFKRTVQYIKPIAFKPSQIVVSSNTFRSMRNNAIGVETVQDGRGVSGLSITNNNFHLAMRNDAGILTNSCCVMITANTTDTIIEGNVVNETYRFIGRDTSKEHALPSPSVITIRHNTLYTSNTVYYPPPTADMRFAGARDDVVVYGNEHHLDNMTETVAWRYNTVSQATVANGYPKDGVAGYGEVIKYGNNVIQYWYEISSTGVLTTWTRRGTTVFSPWTSK